MILLLYICRTWEGDPAPLDAAALAWLRPGRWTPPRLPPADGPLIELLSFLL